MGVAGRDDYSIRRYEMLVEQEVPLEKRREYFRGYYDPEFSFLKYPQALLTAINYVSSHDLRGEKAISWIDDKIEDWFNNLGKNFKITNNPLKKDKMVYIPNDINISGKIV